MIGVSFTSTAGSSSVLTASKASKGDPPDDTGIYRCVEDPMKHRIMAVVACLILVACCSGCGDNGSTGVPVGGRQDRVDGPVAWDSQRKPLAPIPAGTSFGEEPPEGWSDIVLLADGRLGDGDVSDVADGVADYVKMFDIAILANAERDESARYYLEKVGIGFTMKMDGKNTIVTIDSQEKLGADLDMIARDVLSGHEEGLADVRQVARDSAGMIVDVPTLMLHQGSHRIMIVRYLVRVSPDNGRSDTAVWLLVEGTSQQDYLLVEETFEHLPPNMREDRILNVDGKSLTFGLPADDAFAAVGIPRGRSHEFTDEMRKHAGRVSFSEEAYRELQSALTHAMTP